MITKWLCTGDTHGSLERFYPSNFTTEKPEETAIIILGDASFNYYLNKRDDKLKHAADIMSMTFYCVRGNHEARPQDIPGMEILHDDNVNGPVYWQPEYPGIRYLMDGCFYIIDGKTTLVLGGAYSVDKFYRLANGWGWFENEQLSEEERNYIYNYVSNLAHTGRIEDVELVLSHTAPVDFEPREMFLSCIDQSDVDKSTETWLQKIYDLIPEQTFWLFGHYHADMIMGDNIAMLYERIIDLSCIDTFDHGSVEVPEGFMVAKRYQYERLEQGLSAL